MHRARQFDRVVRDRGTAPVAVVVPRVDTGVLWLPLLAQRQTWYLSQVVPRHRIRDHWLDDLDGHNLSRCIPTTCVLKRCPHKPSTAAMEQSN